jgi:hypothetical protein
VSDESKGRAAIDRLTRDIKEHAERSGNSKVTGEQARRQAEAIANRAEQKVIKK